MDNIVETMGQYFLALDKRVVTAGIMMFMLFALIVYVLSIAAIAFRKRKEAVSISLPEIDTDGNEEKTAQFKESEEISIELISPEDDRVDDEYNESNDEAFLTTLVLETGQFVSEEESIVDMPEVGDLDEDSILKKKEKKRKLKLDMLAKEKEIELRNIAKADGQVEVDETEKELIELMKKSELGEADGN